MPLGTTLPQSLIHRVPNGAVADLIDRLWANGELKDLDAEAEVVLGRAEIAAGERSVVDIRLRLSERLAEVSVDPDGHDAERLTIAAAGPVEELLTAAGFHPLRRYATLRYIFVVDGVEVRLAHGDSVGWFCELAFDLASREAARAVERRLGLDGDSP
jgi:hypothetical protein